MLPRVSLLHNMSSKKFQSSFCFHFDDRFISSSVARKQSCRDWPFSASLLDSYLMLKESPPIADGFPS